MNSQLKRHEEFIVKYQINYKSGKKWVETKSVYAYSEFGAIDTIKWLNDNKSITIISIEKGYKYIGKAVFQSNHVLGEM